MVSCAKSHLFVVVILSGENLKDGTMRQVEIVLPESEVKGL
jgi:hypothetical protein